MYVCMFTTTAISRIEVDIESSGDCWLIQLDSWVLTAVVGQNTVDSQTFTNTHTHTHTLGGLRSVGQSAVGVLLIIAGRAASVV